MQTRDELVMTGQRWKKVYYPNLGHFRDIVHEQKFDNEQDAIEYEKMLAARQWDIGGIHVIYVDDLLIAKHPNIRSAAKTNGYYRFRYDYSGEWILTSLNFDEIINEKEEDLKDLQTDIAQIRSHPIYTQASAGTNPLYVPPTQEQSNPLA
jgi:hypothetical protein